MLHLASVLLAIEKSEIDIKPLPQPNPNNVLPTVLNIVWIALGAVSIIVIIISGIRLMTSSGDPQATTKARNTIIYAAVGLVVAISAYTIVSLVIGRL